MNALVIFNKIGYNYSDTQKRLSAYIWSDKQKASLYVVYVTIISQILQFVYTFLRKIFHFDYKFIICVTSYLEVLYIWIILIKI